MNEEENSLKKKTLKNFFWSGSSNLVLQILTLAFGIFLSRILSPTEYGIVGMVLIFTLVATSIQESGFLTALINRKVIDKRDYNSIFWFNVSLGTFLYISLYFLAPTIAAFFDEPRIVSLARYCFITILFSSFSVAQNAYLLKNQQIKHRAFAAITGSIISNVAGITLALLGYSYWAYASINVVYQFIVMLLFWHYSAFRPVFTFSLTPIKEMAPFSLNILTTNIVSQISNNIFAPLLGKFYNTIDVGNYTQGNKWTTTSQSVISGMLQNITQVLLSEVRDSKERHNRIFIKLVDFTCFIAFPCMFILSLSAQDLIVILITEKWIESAVFLQFLTLVSPFLIVSILYTQLILSSGKSDIYRTITISLCLLQIALQLIIYPYGITTMIAGYAVLNIIWLLVWQHYVCKITSIPYSLLFNMVGKYSLITACVILATHFITLNIDLIYFRFISKIFIAGGIYIGIMYLLKAEALKEALEIIKKRKI
ncbi:lipopolysaccharide biosynthesis protein [Sphingobacterium olei]|uniref:lipopolysaccharide biosynthesis protein n=1 Tax=Sphingobacterium olei TaxID=2571155 RepID=UPI0013904088|nr:lipopolysaccharide biosynthesis protein [Sphingobacterium olei]